MATWTTTVDNLIRNFLAALNSSIPAMQNGRIVDHDLIGYDDWERFCDVLFNLLVIEPIRSSRPEDQQTAFDLPAYETQYESYEDFSLIQISAKNSPGAPAKISDTRLWFRFLPDDNSDKFAIADTFVLNDDLTLDDTSWDPRPANEIYFTCLVPRPDRGWELVDKITVALE